MAPLHRHRHAATYTTPGDVTVGFVATVMCAALEASARARRTAVRVLAHGGVPARQPGQCDRRPAIGRGDHRLRRRRTTSFPAEQDANKIEVGGRKGYVRAALDAGVPTTSGSEHRRTERICCSAAASGWRDCKAGPVIAFNHCLQNLSPIIVGFPLGITSGWMPNLPMPAKIVTQVLEPSHINNEFG
jgi:hypothetical protein